MLPPCREAESRVEDKGVKCLLALTVRLEPHGLHVYVFTPSCPFRLSQVQPREVEPQLVSICCLFRFLLDTRRKGVEDDIKLREVMVSRIQMSIADRQVSYQMSAQFGASTPFQIPQNRKRSALSNFSRSLLRRNSGFLPESLWIFWVCLATGWKRTGVVVSQESVELGGRLLICQSLLLSAESDSPQDTTRASSMLPYIMSQCAKEASSIRFELESLWGREKRYRMLEP